MLTQLVSGRREGGVCCDSRWSRHMFQEQEENERNLLTTLYNETLWIWKSLDQKWIPGFDGRFERLQVGALSALSFGNKCCWCRFDTRVDIIQYVFLFTALPITVIVIDITYNMPLHLGLINVFFYWLLNVFLFRFPDWDSKTNARDIQHYNIYASSCCLEFVLGRAIAQVDIVMTIHLRQTLKERLHLTKAVYAASNPLCRLNLKTSDLDSFSETVFPLLASVCGESMFMTVWMQSVSSHLFIHSSVFVVGFSHKAGLWPSQSVSLWIYFWDYYRHCVTFA